LAARGLQRPWEELRDARAAVARPFRGHSRPLAAGFAPERPSGPTRGAGLGLAEGAWKARPTRVPSDLIGEEPQKGSGRLGRGRPEARSHPRSKAHQAGGPSARRPAAFSAPSGRSSGACSPLRRDLARPFQPTGRTSSRTGVAPKRFCRVRSRTRVRPPHLGRAQPRALGGARMLPHSEGAGSADPRASAPVGS
jgi:hypothetical protein